MWTLGHFGLGVGLALVTKKIWRVAFVLTAWEWFENSDTVPLPWGDPSFFNGLVDLVAGLVGFYFYRLVIEFFERKVPPTWREWMGDAVDEN